MNQKRQLGLMEFFCLPTSELRLRKTSVIFLVFYALANLVYGYNFHGCALAPNSDQGWVVTIETTLVYHTWNGGINWEQQHIPTTRDFFDVFFLDTLKGWTANLLASIWHTSDGGLNWRWQNLGGAKFAARIFFLDDRFGWTACGNPIVLRTTTGGNTWEQVILQWLPMDTVDFYGVHFVDSLKGWMVAGRYPELDSFGNVIFKQGQGYIVHSANGGDTNTWVLQKRDTFYDFFDVKFKDTLEGWVVGGNDSTMEACVFHTTNGGSTWHQQTVPQMAKYLRALELIDGNKLWAVGRNGTIIYSSNGGISWQMQTSGVDTTLFDVDFADSLRGLIAGNGVVLYTRDGGDTWQVADVSGVGEARIQNAIRSQASPNPFRKMTTIKLAQNLESHPELKIYDVNGRLIKNLILSSQGKVVLGFWDGRDNQGKSVKSGIYWAIVKQAPTIKLRLIKIN